MREEILIIEAWDGMGDFKRWLDDAEMFYIAYFRMIGADLTNMTDGGDGTVGRKLSEKTKNVLSLQKLGVPKTEEHRRNISLATKGKLKRTDEFKKKVSRANKGKKLSVGHIMKLKNKTPWNKGLTKADHPGVASQSSKTSGSLHWSKRCDKREP